MRVEKNNKMSKLKVVGEWIFHSALYELQDHSSYMTQEAVLENDGFQNQYWAIVSVDENGWYEDTIEDNFKSAEEAWKRYDELAKEEK